MVIKSALISVFITDHILVNKIHMYFIYLIHWKKVSSYMYTHNKQNAYTCILSKEKKS